MTKPELSKALHVLWPNWDPAEDQVNFWWFVLGAYDLNDIKRAIVAYGMKERIWSKQGPEMNKFMRYLKIAIDSKPKKVEPRPCVVCKEMTMRAPDGHGNVFCVGLDHQVEYYKKAKDEFLKGEK